MRQKPRCNVTVDPQLLAKLDLVKYVVPRSEWIGPEVRFGLELFEEIKRMAEHQSRWNDPSSMISPLTLFASESINSTARYVIARGNASTILAIL
jgi:hypothetical protein